MITWIDSKDLQPDHRTKFLTEIDKQSTAAETWLKGETPLGSRGKPLKTWWREKGGELALFPFFQNKGLIGPGGQDAIYVGLKENLLTVLQELRAATEKGDLDELLLATLNRKPRRGPNAKN